MSDESPPPPETSPAALRRELWILAALGAAIAAIALIAAATVPTDEELLQRASTGEDTRERVRALNSLVLRGYWEERPTAELNRFLDDSPPELREFIKRTHGSLLRKR
ncbi:MAG: hypothetical protein AAF957_06290 [Planctomycetota bacterium]